MTVPNPQRRTLVRRAVAAGLVGLLALSGCKSRDGNGGSVGSGGTPKQRDPLVYGPSRIPPQNVPLPDRATKGRDPLTTPTARSGAGYSDDPERFRGSFNPSPSSSPASLAGKNHDPEELRIDTPPDNRVPLRQAGGVVPAGDAEPTAPALDPLFAELAKYGVSRADRSLVREGGESTFRATVPISGNGARRQYTGVGKTDADAVKQVLDQVVADRK